MLLKSLKISNVRNLSPVELDFTHGHFTLVCGANGSGKTSLLEAIYLLSCGRSFRTSDVHHVIQNGQDGLGLFAEIMKDDRIIPVGIYRGNEGKIQVKIDGVSAKLSDLHRLLPVRLVSPVETTQLINGGPGFRRNFLDWGVFHVKHDYWEKLKRFYKILKQRNAALKMGCVDSELNEWNHQFAAISQCIDQERAEYTKQWLAILKKLLNQHQLFPTLKVNYQASAENQEQLLETLTLNKAKERSVGHALYGPQRADLLFSAVGVPAKERLSRGQQKLLAVIMYLAQSEFLYQTTGRYPLFLIDDYSSELGAESQKMLYESLNSHNIQSVITMLNRNKLFASCHHWGLSGGEFQRIEKITQD